jgi:hypothetical protein
LFLQQAGFSGLKFTGMRLIESGKRNSNASATWISNMKTRFAVCVDNSEYPASLEIHKIYRVISDRDPEKDGDVRIIDESGEDYLFPSRYFLAIDFPLEHERVLMQSFDGPQSA